MTATTNALHCRNESGKPFHALGFDTTLLSASRSTGVNMDDTIVNADDDDDDDAVVPLLLLLLIILVVVLVVAAAAAAAARQGQQFCGGGDVRKRNTLRSGAFIFLFKNTLSLLQMCVCVCKSVCSVSLESI
jgi:hypothetical protein